MRILYLHQYFITREMSGGTRSYEMARRLVAEGHQVTILTSDITTSRGGWRETMEEGINVHWLPVSYSNKAGYLKRIWAFLKFAFRASLRSIGLRADVVFATSTPLTIAIPGLFASRVRRIPLVFEVRDLWPELPIALGALKNRFLIRAARWLESCAYANSVRIVALSPGMRAGVLRSGYPPGRVRVIPNSCDLDLFNVDPSRGREFRERYDWLGDRPLVVYAGTVGRINSVTYLVRVAANVRVGMPEVRFLVVGDGQELGKVRDLARELGVLNETLFTMGPMAKEEIPQVLSAATVASSLFLPLPEMWANSANKFFDALAAGRPVAVNYGGWQADLLRETGAGFVLDPVDLEQAADDLVSILQDTLKTEEMGRRARRLAEERFSRDLLADELREVLHAAVEDSIHRPSARGARQ